MAAWHWAGLAISAEVLQLKVRANQEFLCHAYVFVPLSVATLLHGGWFY
ncbi:hypothetical protein [Xanthomonas oryzae]|nr:hypothetical protein [Xanthomonas oryzae]